MAMLTEDSAESRQTLLTLLAQGWPVVEIAAEVGVSERTVYRRIAKLKVLLGVECTRSLMVVACQYGWLDAESLDLDSLGRVQPVVGKVNDRVGGRRPAVTADG